jgi:hypothetical protein
MIGSLTARCGRRRWSAVGLDSGGEGNTLRTERRRSGGLARCPELGTRAIGGRTGRSVAEYRRHVPERVPGGLDRVRTAELIGALSLATDLGIGVPLEDGLHSTLIAMRLAERLGIDPETASQTYFGCLLFYVGCTAVAEVEARIFGEDHALTTYGAPSRFGSRPEMMAGLLRAVALRVAVRFPEPCSSGVASLSWRRRSGNRSQRSARWRRCSPTASAYHRQLERCSLTAPSVGTGMANRGERAVRRSHCRCSGTYGSASPTETSKSSSPSVASRSTT